MGLIPETHPPFVGAILPADAEYPLGKAKNVSTPGQPDGTIWEEGVLNDIFGLEQSLLKKAGITANGNADSVANPQYLTAIETIARQQATTHSPSIVDGGFNIWPEFLTKEFTSEGYSANNFFVNPGTNGGGTATVSRQNFALGQTDVPGNPKFFMNFNQTVSPGSGQSEIEHRVEFSQRNSNEDVTFNFYAKAAANLDATVRIRQNFGSGGSPSASVEVASSVIEITTTWTKFTISFAVPDVSGKTLGTDDNDYFSKVLTFDNGQDLFSLDTSQWFDGEGVFIEKSMREIIEDCQRYYEKSFRVDVPITTADVDTAILYTSSGSTQTQYTQLYKTYKRGEPSITLISPSTGNPGFIDQQNPLVSDLDAGTLNLSPNSFKVQKVTAHLDDIRYQYNYTADARL